MHHVIIGGGPAGVTAAETIRKHDAGAKITLLLGEPEPPYSRMAIPYYLEGKVGEEGTYLRQAADHYKSLGIDYQHARVVALDTSNKLVRLDGNVDMAYDKLLIAAGASPIRPPIEGIDRAAVHTCWTLEDARHIETLANAGEPVVLIGAGFIGCIILESLVKKGVALTVVEMGDRMVPRMLDETAGTMLKNWCEAKGVRVVTGTTVEAITDAGPDVAAVPEKVGFFKRLFGGAPPKPIVPAPAPGGDIEVKLGNGDSIGAKLVVVATGVKANIDFLSGSGLTTGDGVKVDEYLATSAPDVYAAGDIAEAKNLSTGGYDVMAIQPVAVEHGYIAGLNMAGKPVTHRGSLNMNVLDTIGLVSSSFGQWMGVDGGEHATLLDEPGWRYLRLEFDGDRLVGGQAVGMTDHIGVFRGLIQTGQHLGLWKDRLIKSPERLAEAYVATVQMV